jgi:hypothetical protein
VNGHTAIIRSFGTTGVLLVLSLVLLAIVSAIVAFDQWPASGSASTVERVAVDRSEVRRVETVAVRSETPPVVRGAFVARTAGVSASASGADGTFLVADRERGGQSDGGGFGPPPPSVPVAAPGEGGGGPARFSGSATDGSSGSGGPNDPLRQTACQARQALGEAGAALDGACNPAPRGVIRSLLTDED